MLIRDLLGLVPVVPKTFSKVVPQNTADAPLLYGVELEIENVPNWEDMCVAGMESKVDGSLRNNGREFITKPMSYSHLWYCLEKFFTKNKLTEANYSERCSIHVHTNVQDLEWEQLQTIALVYQVVERLLFRWIGHDRESNIFCVPLHQTNITHQRFGADPKDLPFRRWEKYTALNFLPMTSLGTIEWRHMHGHSDFQKIMMWCNLIGHIFNYARNNDYNVVKDFIVSLNTTSAYEHFLGMVFGADMREFTGGQQELEEGVLDVKYGLFDNKLSKKKTKNLVGILADYQPINNYFVQADNPARDIVMDDILTTMEDADPTRPEWAPMPQAPAAVEEARMEDGTANMLLPQFIRDEQARLRNMREAGLRPALRRRNP